MDNSRKINSEIFIHIGILLMLIGLPTSKFVMTVSQIWILFFWVINGISINDFDTRNKNGTLKGGLLYIPLFLISLIKNLSSLLIAFSKNKAAVLLSSVFLMHVIGVSFSEDLHFALKDLRIKLPLLYFPIIFSTLKPIKAKTYIQILLLYVATIFTSTVIGYIQSKTNQMIDGESFSPFISHIRFSMNIVFGIFILSYFMISGKFSNIIKIIFAVLIIWFSIYIFWLESMTGITILIAGGVFVIIRYISFITSTLVRVVLLLTIVAIPLFLGFQFINMVDELSNPEPVDFTQMDKYTAQGNKYYHDTLSMGVEEGRYVGLYYCKKELKTTWEQRSSIPYNGFDKKNQKIFATLIRYLNSKDLRKDAEGVNALSEEDIRNIEMGFANKVYANPYSLKRRIHRIAYGYVKYINTGNANHNSLMQRIEYWKTSIQIIKDSPLIGVGTGDTKQAFKQKYESMDSSLNKDLRHRSHNQFLAITVAFGIIGLGWFLFAFFYTPYISGAYNYYIFNLFMIIASFSMLWEDTLETQAGLTFVVFLYSLLNFTYKSDLIPRKNN